MPSHYSKLSAASRAKDAANKRVRYVNRRRLLWAYLAAHPCVGCGEADPVVLDFDHRDPVTKRGGIADMLRHSMENLLAEIEKCDVRCANCHRRRTAAMRGWYSYME